MLVICRKRARINRKSVSRLGEAGLETWWCVHWCVDSLKFPDSPSLEDEAIAADFLELGQRVARCVNVSVTHPASLVHVSHRSGLVGDFVGAVGIAEAIRFVDLIASEV